MVEIMKIGLVTPFFLPDIGGANIYCFELAKAFAAKGHEVHLFTKKGALLDDAYISHPILTGNLNSDIKALDNYDMNVWHALFFFYAPLALFKKNVFITGHGDDCFTQQIKYNLPGKDFLTKKLLWRFKGKMRAKINNGISNLEKPLNSWIYNRAVKKAKQIITVSNFTRNMLLKKRPNIENKTIVVPPGVSERFFDCDNSPTDSNNNFLTVTRLDEDDRIKNVHGVIKALGELKNNYSFRYVIIGGAVYGNYREELETLITEHGLRNHVFIEGRKSVDELLQCYHDADLFLLVSYAEQKNFEGFGIVFLEANATGTPVLSSREGGMADYIEEGKNGFYVKDTSADGIKDALQKYMDSEFDFDSNTIKEYPESYRWTHIADRIIDIYKKFRE